MRQTLPKVLSAISSELGQLAVVASMLQDQLSARSYAGLDIEAFQSLDSLTQTLSCLTTYVADIGDLVSCRCEVSVDDAAADVCLSALAERLRGEVSHASEPAISTVELF